MPLAIARINLCQASCQAICLDGETYGTWPRTEFAPGPDRGLSLGKIKGKRLVAVRTINAVSALDLEVDIRLNVNRRDVEEKMRKICPAFSIALLMVSVICCLNKSQVAELNEVKAQVLVESKNKEIILKMYERLSNWRMFDYEEFFLENARVNGAPTNFLSRQKEPESPLGVWNYFYMYFDCLPDFNRTIDEVVADGNTVVVRLVNSGMDRDEITFSYRGIHTWHLRDGKIFEGWILDDSLEWLIQMRKAKGLDTSPIPWLWGKSPG